MELDLMGWLVLFFSGAMIALAKTALPGVGILAVPLMAIILPPRTSVGVLLPMLVFADIFAVAYYRRHAEWGHLVRLLPWSFLGLLTGFLALGALENRQMGPLIGGIVLVMLVLHVWRQRRDSLEAPLQKARWIAPILGLTAGFTTMIANAAGPVMILYLLAMRLPKRAFLGTAAWYFMLVNWIKVPFYVYRDMITMESLRLNLWALPCIALAALAGIALQKRIPQKVFDGTALVLAFAAAIKLLLG